MSRFLRRRSRQITAVDEILFYLWEQYRNARNISLVLNTMQLKEGTIRENIIA